MLSFRLAQLIGLTNVAVHGWALWQVVEKGDLKPIVILCLVSLIVRGLKRSIQSPRPPGACACDALGIEGKSDSYGMPSGHVATAVAGWFMIAQRYGLNPWLSAAVAAVAMSWARFRVGCHTLLQGGFGAVVGALTVLALRSVKMSLI